MIKRFFILITLGIHKKEELQALIKKDNFFEFSGFKIIFPSGTTHCKLVGIKGKITNSFALEKYCSRN